MICLHAITSEAKMPAAWRERANGLMRNNSLKIESLIFHCRLPKSATKASLGNPVQSTPLQKSELNRRAPSSKKIGFAAQSAIARSKHFTNDRVIPKPRRSSRMPGQSWNVNSGPHNFAGTDRDDRHYADQRQGRLAGRLHINLSCCKLSCFVKCFLQPRSSQFSTIQNTRAGIYFRLHLECVTVEGKCVHAASKLI